MSITSVVWRAIKYATPAVDRLDQARVCALAHLFSYGRTALGAAEPLAVIGVYGVLSFDVSRRTREIGILSALGASRAHIAGSTLIDAAKLSAIGVAIGIPVAMFATRLMSSLLYTTSPRDPSVYGFVVACIVLVSLVAAYLPARAP